MSEIAIGEIAVDVAVACSLGNEELAQRGDEVKALFSARQETRELPDGYAVRFPGDEAAAARLLAFIAAERACCPFFTFELVFEPRQGPLWLRVRGPDGAKDVVREVLHS